MRRAALALLLIATALPGQAPKKSGTGFEILVREMERGTPIVNALVRVNRPGAPPLMVNTDTAGFAHVRELAPGKYQLSAGAEGFDSHDWTHPAKAGRIDTVQVNLRLQPNGPVAQARCQQALEAWGFGPVPDPCAAMRSYRQQARRGGQGQ